MKTCRIISVVFLVLWIGFIGTALTYPQIFSLSFIADEIAGEGAIVIFGLSLAIPTFIFYIVSWAITNHTIKNLKAQIAGKPVDANIAVNITTSGSATVDTEKMEVKKMNILKKIFSKKSIKEAATEVASANEKVSDVAEVAKVATKKSAAQIDTFIKNLK